MILTITLNPLLDKSLYFKSVKLGEVNRAEKLNFTAGGKGVNISRQLNLLGIDNLAMGFLGGENGKKHRQILHKENIKNSFIQVQSETREGLTIFTEDEVTAFFDPDNIIRKEEVDEFLQKSKKSIQNCEMVVITGSLPITDGNFEFKDVMMELINYANDNDKITILDNKNKNLKKILESKPLVLHLNLTEAKFSFNSVLINDDQKIMLLKELYKDGIKIVILSDGENEFFAMNHGMIYKISPLKIKCINATGSGDAFVAGFIYGLHHNWAFRDILKYSTALGSLNASKYDICNISAEEVNSVFEQVEITQI